MKKRLTGIFRNINLLVIILLLVLTFIIPQISTGVLDLKFGASDRLAYIGAIIGGILTIVGVSLTIKHSDNSYQKAYGKELEREFILSFPQKIKAINQVRTEAEKFLAEFNTIKDIKGEVGIIYETLKKLKNNYSDILLPEAAKLDGHVYVEMSYILEQIEHVMYYILDKDRDDEWNNQEIFKKKFLEKYTEAFDNVHRSIEFFNDYQESMEDHFTEITKNKNIWETTPILRQSKKNGKFKEKLLGKVGLFKREIDITVAHNQTDKNPYHLGVLKFKEEVEKKSNHTIHVDIKSGDYISDEVKLLSKLQKGKIDVVVVSPDVVSRKYQFDELDFLALPYLFDNYNHWEEAVEGKVGKYISSLIERESNNRLRILSYFSAGERHFYGRKPINGIDDLEGMTVRIQTRGVVAKYLSSINAYTNSTPWGEVLKELKEKTIDFAENSYPYFVQQKHHTTENGKYITETGHAYTTRFLLMNGKKFADLSWKQRKIIKKAAEEAAKVEIEAVKDQEKEIKNAIKDKDGVYIQPIDTLPFKQAAESLEQMLSKKNFETKRMIKKIKELK